MNKEKRLYRVLSAAIAIPVIAVCSVLFLIPYAQNIIALKGHEAWTGPDRAYQWLVSAQRGNRRFGILHNGLLPSQEGGDTCFTYDEALAAMAFTLRGDFEKARLIFRFFDRTRNGHVRKFGSFRGFTDTYKTDGTETETRAAGPNAWVLMAINYYQRKTGDGEFLPLARDIADWLLSLQSVEGGIIGGYYGNGKPMVWISSEHNFDCYAGLRDLGLLTGEMKYLQAAKEIAQWLHDDAWDPEARRFFLGRRNPNFATDLSSWAVLSLGGKYVSSLDFAIRKGLNRQLYKVKDIEVEGFDFGSAYQTSPFPDKDAVWFEGTAHMVLAFARAGRMKERAYFLGELERALTDSTGLKFTKGLPYASNEGTPVYDSWMMQDRPLCISSTAWYLFAAEDYNPFAAFGDENASNKAIDELEHGNDYQFVPVIDDFEYSPIKFHTAYPEDLVITRQAGIVLELSTELSADGGRALKITFIPNNGVRTATAVIRRPFLYGQDWSTYSHIQLWVYSTGSRTSSIFANLRVRDREGEVYQSPPIFLNRSGWQRYSFDIWEEFGRDPYDGVTYGDNIFGLSKIIELSFSITSKNPAEETIIYVDRIELTRE